MDTTSPLLVAYQGRCTASTRYTAAFEAAKTLTHATADELCAAHIALNLAVGLEFDARAVASPAELLAYYEAEYKRLTARYNSLSSTDMARFHTDSERARAYQQLLTARANMLTEAEHATEEEFQRNMCGAAYYHQEAA